MKSPTSTILHSIQALKSKLRSDHLQLQGLRRDFAMGPTKAIIETQQRQQSPLYNQFKSNKSLQKNTRNKLIQLRKNHQIQLKAIHQQHKIQKQELIQAYQTKIQEITKKFQQKINQQDVYVHLLEQALQNQRKTQLTYSNNNKSVQTKINNLQYVQKVYQVNCTYNTMMIFDNKIQFELFKKSITQQQQVWQLKQIEIKKDEKQNKYEQIVNNLLKQNAILLESVQTLKMQNRKLIHSSRNLHQKQTSKINISANYQKQRDFDYSINTINQIKQNIYYSVAPILVNDSIRDSSYRNSSLGNKNRLKFSKANNEKSRNSSDRSFLSINNQNIDTSNIFYRHTNSIQKIIQPQQGLEDSFIEDEESQILSEQIKLKTIKHFIKARSHRQTQPQKYIQPYQIQRFKQKKGQELKIL